MTIRLSCLTFCLLFATQCTSTRNWMAANLLGVRVLKTQDAGLTPATTSTGLHTRQEEYILGDNLRPVYTYPLTSEQRVEAMRKIRAAGVDRSHSGDVVYVPVSPSKSGGKKSGRHYVRYDTKMRTPGEVVVLKD